MSKQRPQISELCPICGKIPFSFKVSRVHVYPGDRYRSRTGAGLTAALSRRQLGTCWHNQKRARRIALARELARPERAPKRRERRRPEKPGRRA